MRVSRSPIREGVPKGRALQRCQSFFGRPVFLCQSGHLTQERGKFEWILVFLGIYQRRAQLGYLKWLCIVYSRQANEDP